MGSYQPAHPTPFPSTDDQEDWNTFFDFSGAAQPGFPVYGQGMFGGFAGIVEPPDYYAGYAPDMQGPPISFENHTSRFLAPDDTQWHPSRLAMDFRSPHGQPHHPPADAFHCGMHSCHMTFSSDNLLARHQRFHAPHHWVVSETPFRCECGEKCARLDTLCRHIQRFQFSILGFRCHQPGCTKVFKRKDHLVQHLRHLHKFSDGEVREEFPIHRKVIRLTNPVCPFPSCPYHRDESFKNQPHDYQEANMPFAKQSDYTKHMKNDHDWSPYPCNISYCDKSGKKGYFKLENLQKHRDEQYPEVAPLDTEQ
ncbi:uncharacterized protein PG986_013794 [Apiospora aurea]|uniref:C2H2-type domain-containing protein n=1 Tax=Apiospora aurea TaxID=335848 RepID=A0ABR1PWM2_9PEZI